MALYNPNRKSEFRRSLPPIKERDPKGATEKDGSPRMVVVWEPDPADGVPEFWGPGQLPGDVDMRVRSESDVVHALPGGTMDETVDPAKFLYTLYHEWFHLAKAGWNLEEEVDTGRVDKETGQPVTERRALEINHKNLDDPEKIHPYHRTWMQNELAREFYPEMFGAADPNSSANGKSGTSGTKTGSPSGSNKKEPSQAQHSPSPASSAK